MKTKALRKVLLAAALLASAATLVLWGAKGANRGWTKTEVSEMHTDEVTGLEYPVAKKAFVPGLDFLGLGLGFSAVLALGGWLARPRKA